VVKITIVDQHARQSLAVEFDDPVAIRLRAQEDVRHDRTGDCRIESEAWLGIERPYFGDHTRQVLRVDGAEPHERRRVPTGDKGQVIEHDSHGRVEAIAVAQLQRQAFGQIAREYTGWIEALQLSQRRIDARPRTSETFGKRREIVRQIAGFIHHGDEILPDNSIDRIRQAHRQLRLQMLVQRGRPAQGLIETR